MTRRFGLLVLCLFFAVLTGCGGDDTQSSGSDTTAPADGDELVELDDAAESSATTDAQTDDAAEADAPSEDDQPFVSPEVAAEIVFSDGTAVAIDGAVLDEFIDTLAADESFVSGAFGGTAVPPEFRQSVLGDLIAGAVFDRLVDEREIELTSEQLDDARFRLATTLQPIMTLGEDPLVLIESLPYLQYLVELAARQAAIGAVLVEEAAVGELVTVPCSSHILLATEEEANDVIALLDDGGDFAELAMEFSTGPSGPTGGVLGCTDPNSFVPEFRDAIVDAPVDTIIGPVETQFGFHVITVTSVEEQPLNPPNPDQLAAAEVAAVLGEAEITVDPSLGQWDDVTSQVLPPE